MFLSFWLLQLSDKKERGGLVPSMLVGALAMLGAGTACVVLLGLYRKRQRRRSIKANAASATAAAAGGGATPAEGEGGGVELASGGGGVAELVLSTGGPLLVELPRAGEGEGEDEELDWGEQAGGLGSHDDHSDFSLEGILENLTDIPSVPSMSGGEEEGASTLGEEEDDDADLKQPDSEDEGRGQYQWGEASVESMGKTDEVEASKEGEHTAADGGKAEDEPEPEEGGKVAEEADEEEDEWCVVPETAHPGHSQ